MATLAEPVSHSRWRPYLAIAAYLVVIATLIALTETFPRLDPGGYVGRYVGTGMVAAWCAGLGVLLLGFVRRHNSRFSLKTLSILIAVIAIYLGACQAVRPVFPTLIAAAGLSVAMLYEVQVVGNESLPYRGRLSRTIMAVGGLTFLAHAVRVIAYFAVFQLGLVAARSQ